MTSSCRPRFEDNKDWAERNGWRVSSPGFAVPNPYEPQPLFLRIEDFNPEEDPDPGEYFKGCRYFRDARFNCLYVMNRFDGQRPTKDDPEWAAYEEIRSFEGVRLTNASLSVREMKDAELTDVVAVEGDPDKPALGILKWLKDREAAREERQRKAEEEERKREEERRKAEEEERRQAEERMLAGLRAPDFFTTDLTDVSVPEPMLIDDMLTESGVTLLVGKKGSGKSVVAVSWAASIAAGLPWLGRKTVLCPVLYYDLEPVREIPKRLAATQKELKDCEGSPVGKGALPVVVKHRLPDDLTEWWGEVANHAAEFWLRIMQRCEDQKIEEPERCGGSVVFVDTLRQACGHDDQGPRVRAFMEAAQALVKDEIAAHVVICHHTTKTKGDVYAGASFLETDSSGLFYTHRPNSSKPGFKLLCDRVKGIPKPDPVNLAQKVVKVGSQSAVVLASQRATDQRLLKIAKTLPDRMTREELSDLLEAHTTGDNEQARARSRRRVRAKLDEAGLICQEGELFLRLI